MGVDYSYERAVITNLFSTGITTAELCSVAVICAKILNIKIDRNSKRTFNGLLGWFRKNWDEVMKVLPYMALYDDNYEKIDYNTEVKKVLDNA